MCINCLARRHQRHKYYYTYRKHGSDEPISESETSQGRRGPYEPSIGSLGCFYSFYSFYSFYNFYSFLYNNYYIFACIILSQYTSDLRKRYAEKRHALAAAGLIRMEGLNFTRQFSSPDLFLNLNDLA